MKTWRDRFEQKVDRSAGPDGCHVWTGSRNEHGYGGVRINYHLFKAHRVAMGITLGEPVPDDVMVLHRCDNPPYVNPLHLFLGDQKVNMADASKKGRLHGRRTDPARGERSGNAKVTEKEVLAIRTSLDPYATGVGLGLNKGTVHGIITGKTWKHLPLQTSFQPMARAERRGEHHPASRLNSEAVRVLRYMRGIAKAETLSGLHGLSKSSVYNIQSRRSWGWLK